MSRLTWLVFLFMASLANAGTHIMQGDSAGGALSGTYPSPTVSFSTSPAGSNQQIQYNNSGVFGASSSLSWDNSTKILTTGTPLIQDSVNGYGVYIDETKSGGGNAIGIRSSQTCPASPPQNGYGVQVGLHGACSDVSSGITMESDATSPSTSGISMSLSGASSVQATGLAATVSGASAKNVGVDVSVSNATQNYGILVRNGQVQINSSMTVTNASGINNSYSLSTGSMTITSGPLQLSSRSLAQFGALAPGAAYQMFGCSDCTADMICVSSGTGVGAWVRASARTTACQ